MSQIYKTQNGRRPILFVMKLIIASVFVAAAVTAQPSAPVHDIATLVWMAGSWAGNSGGVEMEEHWMAPKGGAMVGMHRDVVKARMVSFEFFRIEPQNGKLVYLTSPKGIQAVPFTLVESGPMRAVFANPAHDFPQRIIYWKDGADLRARIEGPQNGKTVSEEWRWGPASLR
jgi:Domain of unknown function (DUF6265)